MMKRLLFFLFLIAGCMISVQSQEVEAFACKLLKQYPQARLLDIYKSCFQDYMGAEHLVSDTSSARSYLEYEISTTSADDLMPWYYEPCGTEGKHVRVSLRAVHEGIITTDELLDAFVESANTSAHPSIEEWAERWHEMISRIDQMNLEIKDYESDKLFIKELLSKGEYSISHSPDYREAYSPHYRIVERSIFNARFRNRFP